MFLWWNSLTTVSLINVIAQWIAGIATISVVVLGMRQSTLQAEADAQSKTLLNETKKTADELKAKEAPWELTEQQKETFLSTLLNAPKGPVAVEYIRSDEKRVYNFAALISELLKNIGYDVWGYMPAFQQAGPPLVGIMIQVKNQQSVEIANHLQQGFEKIGIRVVRAVRNNNNHPDSTVVIWIGSKPD